MARIRQGLRVESCARRSILRHRTPPQGGAEGREGGHDRPPASSFCADAAVRPIHRLWRAHHSISGADELPQVSSRHPQEIAADLQEVLAAQERAHLQRNLNQHEWRGRGQQRRDDPAAVFHDSLPSLSIIHHHLAQETAGDAPCTQTLD